MSRHPTFASSFTKAADQYLEDEADRKKAKRLAKSSLKRAIASEDRAALRAAEAKLASTLESLEGRAEGPLGDALAERRISTVPSEEQLPSMRIEGPDVEGEAYRMLTPMEAVRSRMPQGEIGTIENVRAQQSYLAGIEGARGRAAAEPAAMRAESLKLRAQIAAQKESEEETAGLKARAFAREFAQQSAARRAANESVRKEGAERTGRKRRAGQAGESGDSFDSVIKNLALSKDEAKTGGEFFNEWAIGSKEYLSLSRSAKFTRTIANGVADVDAGFTVTNPWSPSDPEYKIFDELIEIARKGDDATIRNAVEQATADALKLETDMEGRMAAAEKEPQFYAAQQAFDKWWRGVESRIPTVGRAGPTATQIAAEAVRRGINPIAVTTHGAGRLGQPRFRDFNYRNLLKLDQGWFTSAELAETKQGGKPVGYNTAFTALGTAERMGDLEVAAQLKKDTATAVRLLDLHNGDLSAMAAAGVSPSVFKLAEDVVHRVGAEAASRVLGAKKTAGMKFEEALKFMNLPANTPYITEPLPSGEPQTIVINSATGPKTVEIFYGTRFHPNLGRNLTPAEIKAAKDERKKRSGFSRNNALSKKMGFDVWDIVE